MASKRIENKIPNVVRIDMTEAVTNKNLIICSLMCVDLFLDSNILNNDLLNSDVGSIEYEGYKMVTKIKGLNMGRNKWRILPPSC